MLFAIEEMYRSIEIIISEVKLSEIKSLSPEIATKNLATREHLLEKSDYLYMKPETI